MGVLGNTKVEQLDCLGRILVTLPFVFLIFFGVITCLELEYQKDHVPNIEIASMDLTVRNITQTRLSANWELLIRIPGNLPDAYICRQGDIQVSLYYENTILVILPGQRYEDLKYGSPQQLRVSAAIVEEDISGLIGENIIKDIKDKKEVKFGSQLSLTDCRKGTTGVLSYVCGESILRLEPGSETKATKFGENPTCTNV